ncbi:hypothetical protein [Edaphobacter modestus]|uniref:Uncharacterized protein n=1 Tax=Edaphobacter modestus TaxID=388466 RepID=A0A4Q7YVY3_9BACT|nr:hypothetical protein [Edaphobacter modestus]RZU41818.1 hypothetical protein BDD14_3355 [Edaphobacter modestus]
MSQLRLRIFDGSRQLFSAPKKFLVRIVDGNQKQHIWAEYASNDITFSLPFFDNLGDNYSVLVSTDGYKQAGIFPVKLSNAYVRTLDVMLVSTTPGFSFVNARWETVRSKYPFLASDVENAAGKARYETLLDTSERSLACFLNLAAAMEEIPLSQGTPLSYIKQLRWDQDFKPAQDRFFSWCDRQLIDQVRIGTSMGQFCEEPAPGLLHPGATHSWKQERFGEANVQLTFHEGDVQVIGGTECVTLEVDIDYYRDPLAHAILEVVPNGLTHALTDPVEVYVLRWMAGQMAGVPEFAPLYTVTN